MSTSYRSEIARLLAAVIWRMHQPATSRGILHPQNLPNSPQDCLASSPETLLSVTTTVNTHGEQGEPQ